VGDQISVYVKDFDPEKKRISLGYKKVEDDPYHNVEERFPIGTIIHGKVVRMFQFGAFIELESGLDALCHVSQISNVRLSKPEDVLSEGMEVVARVLDVNNDTRRISVSIKEVEPIDPDYADEEPSSEPSIDEAKKPDATVVEEDVPAEAAADESVAVEEEPAVAEATETETTEAEPAVAEETEVETAEVETVEAEPAVAEETVVDATEAEAEAIPETVVDPADPGSAVDETDPADPESTEPDKAD
jgi:ribosomal protein S1